jgi:hypothetical protein
MTLSAERPVRRLFVVAVAFAGLAGCAGEGGGASAGAGGSGGTSAEVDAMEQQERGCAAHASWEKRCAELDPMAGEEPTWGETECLMDPMPPLQAAYVEAAIECFDTLGCDAYDDECTSAGIEALGVDEAQYDADPLVQRCLEIAGTCEEFNDDNCLTFVVYAPEARDAAASCLDLACAEVAPCMRDPLGSRQ